MKQFLTGQVELTPEEQIEALQNAAAKDREFLTKAVDLLLKTKGYKPSRIFHQNGRVFADVSFGEGEVPKFPERRRNTRRREMATGWTRRFVGLTRELKEILADWRKKGRREIEFDELYNQLMEVFEVRYAGLPASVRQGKKFQPLDKAKFAGYLHDKRHFPTVKYNSVTKAVRF